MKKSYVAIFALFILCISASFYCGKNFTKEDTAEQDIQEPTGNIVIECKNVDFTPDQVFYAQKDSEFSKQVITKEYYDNSTSDEYRDLFELYDGPVYEYKFVDENGLENITLRTIPEIYCVYAGFEGNVTYNKCSFTGRVYNDDGIEYEVGDIEEFNTPNGPVEKEIIQMGYYYGIKIR